MMVVNGYKVCYLITVMKKIINKDNLLIALSGILFLIFFADSTSPLYEFHYSSLDQDFFITMGRAINAGRQMYSDYFDIKGPLFFWLQALGQRLWNGKTGAFLLEVLFMLLDLILIKLILREFTLKKWQNTSVYLLFYYMLGSVLWNGNTIEEYSLPFTFLCLYLSVIFFKYNARRTLFPFIFGITFSICLFSKITVFAPVAAITLAIMIKCIADRQFLFLIKSAFMFIAGSLVISLPVVLYFYLGNTLDKMILWVFILAFQRAGSVQDYIDTITSQGLNPLSFRYWELFLIPNLVGILFTVYRCISALRSKEEKSSELPLGLLLLPISLANGFVLHLGSRFDYYLIINAPLIVLLAIFTFKALNSNYDPAASSLIKKISAGSVIFIIGLMLVIFAYSPLFVSSTAGKASQINNPADYWVWEEFKEIRSHIPDEDSDDIFCGDYGIAFFCAQNLLPANELPYNSSYFYTIYPPAGAFITDIEKGKHKWLIHQNIDNTDSITPIIEKRYDCIYTGKHFYLFKVKE